MKEVTVTYFALLREQRGLAQETVQTGAATFRELYEELRTKHGLGLAFANVRVARNDDFVDPDEILASGDAIALLPPMAGG